jgi:hypothetical protein
MAKNRFAAGRIARENANLDRSRLAGSVDVGGLIGDVEVDVDRLAGQSGPRAEQGKFLRFTGTLIHFDSPG